MRPSSLAESGPPLRQEQVNRKQRRADDALRRQSIKKAKKANTDIGQKVALFGHLPDECLTCHAPFDKTDRDMVATWHVAVREAEEKVNLYCPDCWQKAINIVESMAERFAPPPESTTEEEQ